METKTATPIEDTSTFAQVAKRYGVSTPEQLKQRIIWNNLKALITAAFPSDDPENIQLLKKYESEFRIAELEEQFDR